MGERVRDTGLPRKNPDPSYSDPQLGEITKVWVFSLKT